MLSRGRRQHIVRGREGAGRHAWILRAPPLFFCFGETEQRRRAGKHRVAAPHSYQRHHSNRPLPLRGRDPDPSLARRVLSPPAKGRETMKTIREWIFPVGLVLTWMLATVYTVSVLHDAHNAHQLLQSSQAPFSPHA